MYKIIIGSFLVVLLNTCHSKELNYIQSHIFRLSAYDRPEEWIIPFYRLHKNVFPTFRFNPFLSINSEVKSAIDDFDSKNENRIASRLDKSFGKPLDASAKIMLSYRYQKLIQTISTNAGAIAVVNDPVFPELEGILFHDYTATTSYIYRWNKKLSFIPKLSYGKRRILDTSLTTAQILNEKPDTKLKNRPWQNFIDLNIKSSFETDYATLHFEANSIPLTGRDYEYWDTNLGITSTNLSKFLPPIFIDRLDLYTSFSPYYGGYYDVSRTVRIGTGIGINNKLFLDLFVQDEFLFGLILKYNSKNISISLFTFERSYDDFHTQRSRQYGSNLVIKL